MLKISIFNQFTLWLLMIHFSFIFKFIDLVDDNFSHSKSKGRRWWLKMGDNNLFHLVQNCVLFINNWLLTMHDEDKRYFEQAIICCRPKFKLDNSNLNIFKIKYLYTQFCYRHTHTCIQIKAFVLIIHNVECTMWTCEYIMNWSWY